MKFISDENIDSEVVSFLRKAGYDVFDIKENNLFGTEDKLILELSLDKERIILSQDSDFGTLVFKEKLPFYGIIYLRPGHVTPSFHIKSLQTAILYLNQCNPPFIMIVEHSVENIKIRIRNL